MRHRNRGRQRLREIDIEKGRQSKRILEWTQFISVIIVKWS